MTSSKTQNKSTETTREAEKKVRPERKRNPEQSGFFRTCIDALFAAASWVSVLSLWMSAASVYVNPCDFRLAAMLGLGFPLVFLGTFSVFVLTVLFAPRKWWITALGMALSFGSIRSYCPINPFKQAITPTAEAFRVMDYNTYNFTDVKTDEDRQAFLQYLLDQQLDIICFEEGISTFPDWDSINPAFPERFPYVTVDTNRTSLTLCSRYPVKRSELVTKDEGNAAVAFWMELPKGDSLLVINCHLKSNQLSPEDRSQYSDIVHNPKASSEAKDSTYTQSRRIAGKIANSAQRRALMADTIADYLSRHQDVPTIVCGDFNDTPISYSCYRIKRTGYEDAFRAVGNGFGRSFNKDAIAVRIDHQFYSSHFAPRNAHIDNSVSWSDHYPLIVTYEWNK